MEAIVLNTDFQSVYMLDTFESFIWTDRYNQYGDFEIVCPSTSDVLQNVKQGYYLYLPDSEHTMIVEDFKINSDAETGNSLTITGRSLESILDRRIVWTQTNFTSKTVLEIVTSLVSDAFVSSSVSDRNLSNFVVDTTMDGTAPTDTITAQYTGDNLYDVVCEICQAYDVGFKITINSSNQFIFKLYSGVDRTYNQDTNPYVVFSPNYENIVDSTYYESNSELKTIALVAGEGEGTDRKTAIVTASGGTTTGLERRELYVDARDISTTTSDDVTLTDAEYTAQLQQRGTEKLADYIYIKSFDGEVDTSQSFSYGKDFSMGDLVQLETELGITATARVTEMIRSQDENGYSEYPTFSDFA